MKIRFHPLLSTSQGADGELTRGQPTADSPFTDFDTRPACRQQSELLTNQIQALTTIHFTNS